MDSILASDPAPISTFPAPVKDVPTTYGDKPDKKSKAERKRSSFNTFSAILAIWCLYGFGTMSLDSATCTILDSVSKGLCNSFNFTLIAKNVIFGIILAFCVTNIVLAVTRKKLARTLGATFAVLTGIAGIALFLVIQNLINEINGATSGLAASPYSYIRLQVEYGVFAIVTVLYAIIEGLYLFRSKYAKETFVN
jgi:uncharacterized membrane protein (UPF0136 family)